jgi:hypothetical protein
MILGLKLECLTTERLFNCINYENVGLQLVLIFRHITYNETATELIHARDPFIYEVRVTLVSLLM